MPAPDQLLNIINTLERKPDDILKQEIRDSVQDLINNNFTALVELLYRIDIDEKKLKQLLKSPADEDAASIITDLIIERQMQKNKTRNQLAGNNKPTGDDSW